jgi:hypothetical protein
MPPSAKTNKTASGAPCAGPALTAAVNGTVEAITIGC